MFCKTLISTGLDPNSINSLSSSDDPFFESAHPQGAEGMLFSGSDSSNQYPELPKLDGLDNLCSDLDAAAVDEGGSNYPKITF
jgi:hypothetical protein